MSSWTEKLTPQQRKAAWGVVISGVFLFLLARWLVPDPRGIGTHEQLGLPPCTTELIFGIPCPLCGMTTAVSLMARGRVAPAFRVQPAGALAFLIVAAIWGASIVSATTGRGITWRPSPTHRRIFWVTAVVLILLGWVYKIATRF